MKKKKTNRAKNNPKRLRAKLLQLKSQSRQIAYIQADGNYSVVHYKGEKCEWICYTLKECENALQKRMFIRCNRSFLVNSHYISKVNLKKQLSITLRRGIKIDISRRRRNKVATAPAVVRKAI